MKTQIPARTQIFCDACNDECTNSNYRQEGKLIVKQHALDYLGSPCANGNAEFDLCDKCLNHLNKTLNEELEHIRNISNEAKRIP